MQIREIKVFIVNALSVKLKLLTEIDESQVIELTTTWMAAEYDRLNQSLFDGKLMACDFAVFTSGKGAEGGTLGWFKITGKNVYASKSSHRIYHKDGQWGYKTFVTRENFVEICKPRIELNGNYRWTKKAAISTLVHEMCHYYCNMNGWRPTQHHGPEFRSIAFHVSQKSNEFFTVERIAKAEQMEGMELNDAMAAKKQKRLDNKKSRIIAIFVFKRGGQVRLINAVSREVLLKIERIEFDRNDCEKIVFSQDANLIQRLFDSGYKSTMRGYRYWDVSNEPFVKELENYDIEVQD